MISKELLSAVLGKVVRRIEYKEEGKRIYYDELVDDIDWIRSVNIHELAHKCKEWARVNRRYRIYSESAGVAYLMEIEEIQHYAKTEPEAIFKACQWILENKQ